jgi:hypothetical protein
MEILLSALATTFAVVLALWPIVLLIAVVRHSLARRWRQVGKLALLLPLWMMAASLGLRQVVPLFMAVGSESLPRSPFFGVVATGVAVFCALLAWGLLLHSFGARSASQPAAKARG